MAVNERWRVLVINPNTTQAMTEALKPLINKLRSTTTTFEYFTAPDGVPSINDNNDCHKSMHACLPHLVPMLDKYDAFLVACYSQHPLVDKLRTCLIEAHLHAKPVTGIFEASIATCVATTSFSGKFGIISTGAQWQLILNDAVALLLGTHASGSPRYAGTQTTGLNANELHDAPKVEITRLMGEATRRLLNEGASSICLGCAGMAGLDGLVRQACIDILGEAAGRRIRIVDGVVSGALQLESELRALAVE